MSDVLAAYLMLTELLFLSPNFISFQDVVFINNFYNF